MGHRPVSVAPLILETEEERQIFKKGEANYQAKKALRTKNLLKKAPDSEESELIHAMWTKEASYLSMYFLFFLLLPTSTNLQ